MKGSRPGTPVPAEAWALFSTFCFAGGHVVSKRGLQDTSVIAGSLVLLAASFGVIAVAVVLDPPARVTSEALLVYGGLGLVVPAISRGAALKAVDSLGPSIAIPIQHGLRPILAVGGAVLLLGETVGPLQAIGIGAIIAGGWQLSRRPRQEVAVVAEVGAPAAPTAPAPTFRPGVVFPLIAAVAYAASDLLIRATVGRIADPGFAAFVSAGSGLAVWLIAVGAVRGLRARLRFGRGVWWLALAGGLIGLAILSVYEALLRGDVSIVSPINSTQPLVVLLLSSLMLRDIERIRPMTLVSGIAIVAGAILVTL